MPFRYRRLLKEVKRKDKVRIVFLIQLASSWKYDYLFQLFLNDDRFDPIIAVCPVISYSNDNKFMEMDRAIHFFQNLNYPVYPTWKKESREWVDIKKDLKPDIVFFSNPWADLSMPRYYIYSFLDTLSCYVPYGFKSSHLYQAIFNKPFQNLLWKIFYETEFHKSLAKKYGRNKGRNGVVTGYPGMDNLLSVGYESDSAWGNTDTNIKRIIWSPHHSIFGKEDSNVGFSTFLKYYNFMIDVTDKYRSSVHFSFKPHPLLKSKLYKHKDWGRERTDNYYSSWDSSPNTQLNEGNYIDLFLGSDAIINDGESFMVEYLYTKMPAMFLVADDTITDRFNEFGKKAYKNLYKGYSEHDITSFINDVIIGGNDYKAKERIEFFDNQVKPPNDVLASENIFNCISLSVSGKQKPA